MDYGEIGKMCERIAFQQERIDLHAAVVSDYRGRPRERVALSEKWHDHAMIMRNELIDQLVALVQTSGPMFTS